jgi:hypothetical protein
VNRLVYWRTGAPMRHVHHPKKMGGAVRNHRASNAALVA